MHVAMVNQAFVQKFFRGQDPVGKYIADFGNTPGHVNHWSRRGFLDLLARRFEIVAVRAPLPWTMALCKVR